MADGSRPEEAPRQHGGREHDEGAEAQPERERVVERVARGIDVSLGLVACGARRRAFATDSWAVATASPTTPKPGTDDAIWLAYADETMLPMIATPRAPPT